MNKISVFLMVCAGLAVSLQSMATSSTPLSLSASVRQALVVAPEIKTADAEIGKQQGKLEQAGSWPNPRVSVQIDDKLGIEDASGGYDVTQLEISQPLPISRLKHQRKQAEAELSSAEAQRRNKRLLLEYKVAQRFHQLQLAAGKLELAEKRLRQAASYQGKGTKRSSTDPLIRYLTPLERMRLDIVLQTAKQTLAMAEGEYNEAEASLKALLMMSAETELEVVPLTTVAMPAELKMMEKSMQLHPALEADQQMLASSQAAVDVAEAQRFDDPVLTVFSAKDFLANRRQNTNGIMLSVQVPLWNANKGKITQARASVRQARAELSFKQRELETDLHKNYLHLGHLIEQAEHYRIRLLQPARQVLTLTRKGFLAGELNVLALIDANNIYFDAQERYFELLQEGWIELAGVRKSAGLSLLANTHALNTGEVK